MGLQTTDLLDARRVLCVQPHYDDNDLGAGGTIAALADAGAEVTYLTVTDDLVGVSDSTLGDEESTRRLRQEQVEAGAVIGVQDQHWLGYPDAGPYDYYVLRTRIIEQIRRRRPDLLFTVDPWLPDEAHQDHLKVGMAVAEASFMHRFLRLATHPEVDESYQPYDIQGVVFYFTRSGNLCFDIEKTRERKHRAMDCYATQLSPKELALLHPGLEMLERRWAEAEGFTHGESLRALAPGSFHVNILG